MASIALRRRVEWLVPSLLRPLSISADVNAKRLSLDKINPVRLNVNAKKVELKFTPPKNKISPLINALSKYYNTPPAFGLQGRYVVLIRELSEFGDTVGVLDAHRALLKRNVPLHLDAFQTLLHHFARIEDVEECYRLLHEAVDRRGDLSSSANGAAGHAVNGERLITNVAVPRRVLYNSLLCALIEHKLWRWCDKLLQEMSDKEVEWDELTYILTARMHLQAGHPERMPEILTAASERGFPATSTMYNYVLMNLQTESERRLIEQKMRENNVFAEDVKSHQFLRVLFKTEKTLSTDDAPLIPPQPSETPIETPNSSTEPLTAIHTDTSTQTTTIPEAITDTSANKTEFPTQNVEAPTHTENVISFPSQSMEVPIQNAEIPIQYTESSTPYPPIDVPPPPMPLHGIPPLPIYNNVFIPQYMYQPPLPLPYQIPLPPPPSPFDIRIHLQIPNVPPPQESNTPSRDRPGATAYTTLEQFREALQREGRKGRRVLLRDMAHKGIVPDESILQVILDKYTTGNTWMKASAAWEEFEIPPEHIQKKLVPLMVPDMPFEWRVVATHFQSFKTRPLVLYDEFSDTTNYLQLLTKTACPGKVEDFKELLVFMASHNIAPSRDALVSGLVKVFSQDMQELEKMLDWLVGHGVVLDQPFYSTLAQKISKSSSPSTVKRDSMLFLHRSMKQRRIVPDHSFYSTALRCIMKCNEREPCALLLLSMRTAGVRLDQPMYSLLTAHLLRVGDIDMAEQVDEDMRTGASDIQVALHYGYLRALQDRGQFNGLRSNSVVPALNAYYQQFSPSPLSPPTNEQNDSTSSQPKVDSPLPSSNPSIKNRRNRNKKHQNQTAKTEASNTLNTNTDINTNSPSNTSNPPVSNPTTNPPTNPPTPKTTNNTNNTNNTNTQNRTANQRRTTRVPVPQNKKDVSLPSTSQTTPTPTTETLNTQTTLT